MTDRQTDILTIAKTSLAAELPDTFVPKTPLNSLCHYICGCNVEVVTVINAGESFASLHFTYRIGKSTVGEIIYETCQAIASILQPQYLQVEFNHLNSVNIVIKKVSQ